MKRFALFICCFSAVYFCSGAPFTKDSFVVTMKDPSGTNYLQEYDIEGTKLQRIDFPEGKACGGCRVHTDETGLLLVLDMYNKIDSNYHSYVHTMNSQGDTVDITDIDTGAVYVYCAAVNGQDVYMSMRYSISYTTRGATSFVNQNILTDTQTQAYDMLVSGSRMFLNIGNPRVLSPIPTTGTGTLAKLGPNSGLMAPLFYAHPNAIYAFDSNWIFKYSFDAQGNIGASSDYYGSVDRGSNSVAGITAVDVKGVTYVILTITNGFTGESFLVRFTDTGSSLVDQTTLDQGASNTYKILFPSPSPKMTCSDGLKNQNETDVDCGGDTCSACSNNKACSVDNDCSSGYCKANVCATPTCDDDAKNQEETDVDCGGPNCSACSDTKSCLKWTDCLSGYCTSSNICDVATCNDQVKNQGETDIDCGGGTCSMCATGKNCSNNNDCLSLACDTDIGLCVISCADGIKNQDETDIDCGGSNCSPCDNTQNCLKAVDCSSNYCNPDNKCSTPSCSDGLKNQDETDIDCGGNNCTSNKCVAGQSCAQDSDCDTSMCSGTICVIPPIAAPSTTPPVTPPVAAPTRNLVSEATTQVSSFIGLVIGFALLFV